MVNEIPKLNITQREQPEFRPKSSKQELLNLRIQIVNDTVNNNLPSFKEVHLMHGDEQIGGLDFEQYPEDKFIKINKATLDNKYKGNDLGMKLYETLISFAKENNFEKIKSDNIVQGGAIAVWIKLSDKYKVLVNPSIQEKYTEFVKIYKDNKFFKDYLSVSPGESVFELDLK